MCYVTNIGSTRYISEHFKNVPNPELTTVNQADQNQLHQMV